MKNIRPFINEILVTGFGIRIDEIGFDEKENIHVYSITDNVSIKFVNDADGKLEFVHVVKTNDGKKTEEIYIDYKKRVIRFAFNERDIYFNYCMPIDRGYNLEMYEKYPEIGGETKLGGYTKDGITLTTLTPCEPSHRASCYKISHDKRLSIQTYNRSDAKNYILSHLSSNYTVEYLYELLLSLGMNENNILTILRTLLCGFEMSGQAGIISIDEFSNIAKTVEIIFDSKANAPKENGILHFAPVTEQTPSQPK